MSEKEKTFAEQIDDVLSGADTTSSHLEVLKVTPPLLRMVGVPNLPILMTARHVRTITQEDGTDSVNYHGLGVELVKQLPELISDPVMIMDSLTKDDSIVVVTQTVDKENRPVIGAIKLNGIGRQNSKLINANILTSAYGKDNFPSFIKRNIEQGAVLYVDKEKSQALSVNPGIQFPDVMASLSFNTIIRKTNAFVNITDKNILENTKKSEGSMNAGTNNQAAQSARERVQQVRDEMVKMLLAHIEKNPTDWQSGWNSIAAGAPYNGKTNTAYRGINALYLAFLGMERGYKDTRWVTFNQAKELGASVKKGEKSSPVIFFEFYDRATKKAFNNRTIKDMTDEERAAYLKENVYAVLKYSSVFNAEQCHNFPERKEIAMSEDERANQNAKIETIIANSAAPVLYDGGNRAYYSPGTDKIHLPVIQAFDTMQDYYATALHEIAHSTGHASRLNRDLSGGFGSASYATEELRAELACVFMQMEQGIQLNGKHIENHAAYLNSWLEAAKNDTSIFFKAAADAQKISDYVAQNYMQADDVAVIEEEKHEENEAQDQPERNPMVEYLRAESDKQDEERHTMERLNADERTSAEKLIEARAQARRLAAETGEPYVTFEWTEKSNGFPDIEAYDVMSLSVADKKLAALDALADKNDGYFKTKLHIDCVFEGKPDAYEGCRYYIGAEGGGLVHHIDKFLKNDTFLSTQERTEAEAALEYFKQHIEVSEYLANPERLADLSEEELGDVNMYVSRARDVLNNTEPFSDYQNHMPLTPEEVKKGRDAAHVAGLPFYEGNDEDFEAFENAGGLVYDGNMSVEDYKRMWELREQSEGKIKLGTDIYVAHSIYSNNQKRKLRNAHAEAREYASQTGEPYITVVSTSSDTLEPGSVWFESGNILNLSEAEKIFKNINADFVRDGGTADVKIDFDFIFEGKHQTYKNFDFKFGSAEGSLINSFKAHLNTLKPKKKQIAQDYAAYFEQHLALTDMVNKAIADNLPIEDQYHMQWYVLNARHIVNEAVPFSSYALPEMPELNEGVENTKEKLNKIPHYEISFALDYSNEMLLTNALKELGYSRDNSLDEINERNDIAAVNNGEIRWVNGIRYLGADGKSFQGFYGRTFDGIMLEATNMTGFTASGLNIDEVNAIADIVKDFGVDVAVKEIPMPAAVEEKITLDEARNVMLDAQEQRQNHYAVRIENVPYTDPEDGYETEEPAQVIYTISQIGHIEQYKTIPLDSDVFSSDLPNGSLISYEPVEYEELEEIAQKVREPIQMFKDVLRAELEEGTERHRSDAYYDQRVEDILDEHYRTEYGLFERNIENPKYLSGTTYLSETFRGERVISLVKNGDGKNTAVIESAGGWYAVSEDYHPEDGRNWGKVHRFDNQVSAESFRVENFPSASELSEKPLESKSFSVEQKNELPLVINLFAGPGAGKTTAALELTAALKKVGYNVEYVSEYAKELVLEKRFDLLDNQEHVTDEQYHRLDRLRNSGVEIIVTDSPVLLGKIYGEGRISAEYDKKIADYHDSFNNFNLVVKRGEGYQQAGRRETLSQAQELDSKITTLLLSNNLFYSNYNHDEIEKTVNRINTTYNRLFSSTDDEMSSNVEEPNGEHKEKIDLKEKRLREYADTLRRNDLEVGNTAKTDEEYINQARAEIASYEQSDEYQQALREDFPNDFIDDLTGDTEMENNSENEKEKTIGEELREKTTWSRINLPENSVGKEYGQTTLIKMPTAGEYKYFGLFVPTRYLQQNKESGKWQLNVGDNFTYRLNNDGRQVELTGKELKNSFAGEIIGKEPVRVAPSRNYSKVLDQLEKNVPNELRVQPNWCVYRTWKEEGKEKKGKVIKSAVTGEGASPKRPADWTDFDTAMKYARQNNFEGLAFVLDRNSGITCIDLDKCVKSAETGEMKERAAKLIKELNGTYMERSASGNGVHIFLKDDILKGGKYKESSVNEEKGDLEVFDNQRIISMTGNMFSATNSLTRAGSAATVYLRQELGEKQQINRPQSSTVRSGYKAGSDREVVERIRRSKRAGDFEDLYTGHGITGNASVDDMKLANILAFFTNGDAAQCMRIMREASTYRSEKSESYYNHTISKAIETLSVRPSYGAAQSASANNKAEGKSSGFQTKITGSTH